MAELTYGVYQRAKVGYQVSGDAYWIQEDKGRMLICLADGLGSGPKAAEASQAAVRWVADHPQFSLIQMLEGCHQALRATRGAVMALSRIDIRAGRLCFVGVGNIEFHAWSAEPIRPISMGGIVGNRLPSLREFCFTFTQGDLVMMHTDGISRRFVGDGVVEHMGKRSPQHMAQAIAADYAKQNDDVTLLVISSMSE